MINYILIKLPVVHLLITIHLELVSHHLTLHTSLMVKLHLLKTSHYLLVLHLTLISHFGLLHGYAFKLRTTLLYILVLTSSKRQTPNGHHAGPMFYSNSHSLLSVRNSRTHLRSSSFSKSLQIRPLAIVTCSSVLH